MNWKTPSSMREAMSQIPDGAAQDAGYSTPDIYGRASQLYLSLEKAVGQTGRQDDEDVRLWRGFLTLLALRHAQNLPPGVAGGHFERFRYGQRRPEKPGL